MKRALAFAATVAAASGFAPAAANAQARDGAVQQAVFNTAHQMVLDACAPNCTGADLTNALNVANSIQPAYAAVKAKAAAGTCGSLGCSFLQILKGVANRMPWPYQLGDKNDATPFFGGGGNTGTWPANDTASGQPGCSSLQYKLDAAGNMIIPSYSLKVGTPFNVGPPGDPQAGDPIWRSNGEPGAGMPGDNVMATDLDASIRRALHTWNMKRLQQEWWGVIGPDPTDSTRFLMASVAYRNMSGTLIGRNATTFSASPMTHSGYTGGDPEGTVHRSCPDNGEGSTDFHFYGESERLTHVHGCIHFIPNQQFGWNGYAINRETTILMSLNWPKDAPAHLKNCQLSADFIAKLTEAMLKEAGHGEATVQPSSARPGDTNVDDLGDDPTTGATPNTPPATPTQPDPGTTPTTPTQPSGGMEDKCDFGEGGCDNPNTASPNLDDPPTNIMDPIFDWLPDLPSITIPTQDSQCPVWNVDLRDYFGGSTGQFLLDSHCELMDDPGLTAALGALMIALFGITAAFIVLRA